MTKYSAEAIRPVPPRETTYETSWPTKAAGAAAAASAPKVIDHCEPRTEPDSVHQKVARVEVCRGR